MPCFTPMIVCSQSEGYFLNTKPGRSLYLTGSSKTQQSHFIHSDILKSIWKTPNLNHRLQSSLSLVCSFLEINTLTDFSWLVWRIFAALPLEKDSTSSYANNLQKPDIWQQTLMEPFTTPENVKKQLGIYSVLRLRTSYKLECWRPLRADHELTLANRALHHEVLQDVQSLQPCVVVVVMQVFNTWCW